MNISVCSPSIYTPTKGSSKGYLFTDISNVAHNLYMLWKSWNAIGQAGSTSAVQRTEPFWSYAYTLYRMYLKCFDRLQDWVPPHPQKEKRLHQCISANNFRGTALRFTLPHSFRFLSVGTLKNPIVCRFRSDKADYLPRFDVHSTVHR